MATIKQRPKPSLTTHTACTGVQQVRYGDPERGTISFSADDGTESGNNHGEVEILSHDQHGVLAAAYTLSADDWRKVVDHIAAGLPKSNLLTRCIRWISRERTSA